MSGAPGTVTIDGPVGSGKGTIAGKLAARIGWHLLDSGALYRLVAIKALDLGLDEHDPEALAAVAGSLDFEFRRHNGETETMLEGCPVTDRLRSEEVSAMASRVAALPAVRAALLARQQAFRRPPGLVADGRDMGTVVFPDAALKIFLTASVEARADRRYKQLKEKGESVNLSRLLQDLQARDRRDSSRAVAPLKPAKDAVLIDSTDLTIEEVVNRISELLEERKLID